MVPTFPQWAVSAFIIIRRPQVKGKPDANGIHQKSYIGYAFVCTCSKYTWQQMEFAGNVGFYVRRNMAISNIGFGNVRTFRRMKIID